MKKDDRIGRFEPFERLRYRQTNQQTDRPSDRPTDMTSYRSARTHLKERCKGSYRRKVIDSHTDPETVTVHQYRRVW